MEGGVQIDKRNERSRSFHGHRLFKMHSNVASAGKVAYLILLYANAWVNFDKSSVLDVAEVDFKVGGAFGRDG